jgi:hypothetical protein
MSPAVVWDVVAYGALLAVVLSRPAWRAAFGGIEPWRRIGLLALVVAVPAGQVIHRSEWTYPFVAWAMYTDRRPGDVTWYEYTLVGADGTDAAWPLARGFSRLGKRVVWRLRLLEEAGRTADADRLLRELAGRRDWSEAGAPADSVRVWTCAQPIATGADRPPARRTLLRSVAVRG